MVLLVHPTPFVRVMEGVSNRRALLADKGKLTTKRDRETERDRDRERCLSQCCEQQGLLFDALVQDLCLSTARTVALHAQKKKLASKPRRALDSIRGHDQIEKEGALKGRETITLKREDFFFLFKSKKQIKKRRKCVSSHAFISFAKLLVE